MPMSLARRLECLALLGWSCRGFADMIGVPEKVVRLGGELPDEVEAVLEKRAQHAEANPLPVVDPARADAVPRKRGYRWRREVLAA